VESLEEEPLTTEFWGQFNDPSPWSVYGAETTAYGGGLELDNPVFGNSWTKYWGAHAWFDCDPEQPCECEGPNCLGAHSTNGHAAAGAATAKSALVPMNGIEPPTPTPSNMDAYIWHW